MPCETLKQCALGLCFCLFVAVVLYQKNQKKNLCFSSSHLWLFGVWVFPLPLVMILRMSICFPEHQLICLCLHILSSTVRAPPTDHTVRSLTSPKFQHREGRWTLMRRVPSACYLVHRNTPALSVQAQRRMFVNYLHLHQGASSYFPKLSLWLCWFRPRIVNILSL